MEEGTIPLIQETKPYKFFISGLVSGIVTTVATQPIDTIKTRQQVAKLQLQIEQKSKPIYKNLFRKF